MPSFENYVSDITNANNTHRIAEEIELLFVRTVLYGAREHALKCSMSDEPVKPTIEVYTKSCLSLLSECKTGVAKHAVERAQESLLITCTTCEPVPDESKWLATQRNDTELTSELLYGLSQTYAAHGQDPFVEVTSSGQFSIVPATHSALHTHSILTATRPTAGHKSAEHVEAQRAPTPSK
ncbi:MAG: hypothetical protein P1U40_04085 [Coxiellaceae bacterium]|nr:hypothetical protein [Coxiellaceae bacterium]